MAASSSAPVAMRCLACTKVFMRSNDELERPIATVQLAPRAHHSPALAAPPALVSRPLQALVRRPRKSALRLYPTPNSRE
jgi:hypothetical protein